MKKLFKKILSKIPYVNFLENEYQNSLLISKELGHAPGHFYSTIPSVDDIKKNNLRKYEEEIISDIDLNENFQFQLLKNSKSHYDKIPYSFVDEVDSLRYKLKDAQYRYSDVIFLFSIINEYKPKKIIEIGSGYSSAVMMDTNDLFFNSQIDLTFIEPYPENRLLNLIKKDDYNSVQIIKGFIQDIDLNMFDKLEENDILFIDSSHVSKLGSDLNHIIFNILPVLKPGVLIHFHDIFYPFELPKKWISERNWFWNENYIIRAFLMNNNNYKMILFNSYLHFRKKQWLEENMPVCLKGAEETGSLWIQKK